MTASMGKDVEKLEASFTAGGNANWFSYVGKQPGGSSNG